MTKQSDDVALPSPTSIEQESTIVPSTSPVRPLIVHVYSRRRETEDTCLSPITSSPDLELPIALRKGTRTCKSTYSIANFVSSDRLSSTSRSLIVSLGNVDNVSVRKTMREALNHPG